MKTFLTSLLVLVCIQAVHAQVSQKKLDFTGSNSSIASAIKPSGNGFILAGSIGNNNHATRGDIALIHTDSSFNPVWSKQLSSFYSSGSNGFPCAKQRHLEYVSDIIEVADGFLIVGTHDIRDGAFCNGANTHLLGEFDIVVAKVDSVGDPIWSKRYGNGQTQMATDIIATRDGGFLISGFSNAGAEVLSAALPFVMKIDAQGDVLWSKRQSNFAFEGLSALFAAGSWRFPIKELQNGDLAYAASTGKNTFIVRLDSVGTLKWARTFYHGDATGELNENPDWAAGAASYAFFHSLIEHPNGNLSIVGNLYFVLAVIIDPEDPFGASFVMGSHVEMDATGNYVRSSIFSHPTGHSGAIWDLATTDAQLLPNGNLLIGGLGESYAFMLEYDPSESRPNEHSQWARHFRTYNYSSIPFGYDLPSVLMADGRAHIVYDDFKLGSIGWPVTNTGCVPNWGSIQSISLGAISLGDVTSNMRFYEQIGMRGTLTLDAKSLDSLQLEDLCNNSSIHIQIQPAQPQLSVIPNPSSGDALNIQLDVKSGQYEIQIIDLQGKVLLTQELTLGVSTARVETDLKPGMYVVFVRGNSRQWSTRVVVR
ncbi:MAG: T9SS type A sorting domain-containing protein [Bacteroidia bacterium]